MQIPTLRVALASGLDAKIHNQPAEGTVIQVGCTPSNPFKGNLSLRIAYGLGTHTLFVVNENALRAQPYKFRTEQSDVNKLVTFKLFDYALSQLTEDSYDCDREEAFIIAIVRLVADIDNRSSTADDVTYAEPQIHRGTIQVQEDTRLLVFVDKTVKLVRAGDFFAREDIKILNLKEPIASIILDHIKDINKLTYKYGVGFRYDCSGEAELNLGSSPDIAISEYYNCTDVSSLRQLHHTSAPRRVDLSQSKINHIPQYLFFNSAIEEINLPEGITELNTPTFLGCKNLKYLDLPQSLERIELGAFQQGGIQLLVIPENCKTINITNAALPDLYALSILGKDINWLYNPQYGVPKNKITLLQCDLGSLVKLDNMVGGILNIMPYLRYINNKPISYYQTETFAATMLLSGYSLFMWRSDN